MLSCEWLGWYRARACGQRGQHLTVVGAPGNGGTVACAFRSCASQYAWQAVLA